MYANVLQECSLAILFLVDVYRRVQHNQKSFSSLLKRKSDSKKLKT